MIALQKILVPTDFSDFSPEALEFALTLAESSERSCTLCTFGSFPYGEYQGRGRRHCRLPRELHDLIWRIWRYQEVKL